MNADKKKVNAELKRLGFGGLEDKNLLDQMAVCVRDHRHFRGILLSVPPEQRKIAYEQLSPRLLFKPKTLEAYEIEGKQNAEQMQVATCENGGMIVKDFKSDVSIGLNKRAEDAIKRADAEGQLTFDCSRCTRSDSFPAQDRLEGIADARRAGWRFKWGGSKLELSTCPECSKFLAALPVVPVAVSHG